MTPHGLSPSRLTSRLLRATLDRDRANAVLGDLNEDLARRVAAGTSPRWPRAWLEWRAFGCLLAAVWSALPVSARTWRYIVRDAGRSLRSAPGSTAFILFILTLGIAAATVTFSVVDTVVLRHLPFDHSEELVVVSGKEGLISSAGEFLAWRDHAGAFSGLAAVRGWGETLQFGSSKESVRSAMVTASLFDVLRARPLLGQVFTSENEISGNNRVAVISYGLWQRRFGGDAGVVGQTLPLADRAVLILGVMPRDFAYPISGTSPVELWTPWVVPQDELTMKGISRSLHVVGRVRPGVGEAQALAMISGAMGPLAEQFPAGYRDWQPKITPLYDTLVGDVRGWMLLVLWAVGLVMIVACVNVANLLLTRSTYRSRELAIRASLGATRRQLIVALIAESLLLSLSAAALGVLVAAWGVGAARAALPLGIARASDIALDLRVLTATIVAALTTGLLFGAVPAWQASRTDLVSVLKDSASTVAGGRRVWRTAFLVLEVAFAGVLLVATTLFVSSFVRVTRADLGFERSRLISISVQGFRGDLTELIEPMKAIGGVASVAAVSVGSPPLIYAGFGAGGSASAGLRLPDAPADAPPVAAEMRRVSPAYFETVGIQLVRGQLFGFTEPGREVPVIIDELAARRLFGDRDPIGADVLAAGKTYIVGGIVANVRLDGPERQSGPQIYFPIEALTVRALAGAPQLVVRTSGTPSAMVPALQATLARVLPSGTRPPQILVVEEAFRRITADRRFNAGLMSIFGVLALFIGAAGVYGVMASVVAQQTREIGVRVALGATTSRIRRDVIAQAGRYMIAGLALGLSAAWWISRMFTSLLFQVRPTDVYVYVAVATLLIGVGVVAALVPARRAARVDPIVALRG